MVRYAKNEQIADILNISDIKESQLQSENGDYDFYSSDDSDFILSHVSD
jgi:hypothetical protein